MATYQALVLVPHNHQIMPQIQTKEACQTLPAHQVTVKVQAADLNHKDYLALKPDSKVIYEYPRVGGIDFAGTVTASNDARFIAGETVFATGYGLGTDHDGGFQQSVTVPGDWLQPLPDGMDLKEVMYYGTAGLTAALAVSKLLDQPALQNYDAPILITGVTGSVGSLELAILNKLGYTNLTVVSRQQEIILQDELSRLGATHLLKPAYFLQTASKPLQHQEFSAVLDSVGGDLLAAILPHVTYEGRVTMAGNSAGNRLKATVLPFILRGITLYGIDSVYQKEDERKKMWHLLATKFNLKDWPHPVAKVVAFDELPEILKAGPQTKLPQRTLVEIS
ncbi:hypothetical protein IV38_GL001880 [Lactobacillus selangorensis]|uniref:Enoyl reductase (ER) domain-containing protein n=1 Tax=Lactobacillus selangorensis TaxID=81857 RepID=A0A0R2FSN2_9LACO|nr:YhdH/YhfP family quinone oxidoreductase [Lactobacillus selangorensis]KRN27668.1 hypothetical protein IV38_GL001880 [Lactobacillus selangorensis]KRN30365.1 hypothetical protein IV40_GL001954 [Lactobacillus selangorensis]